MSRATVDLQAVRFFLGYGLIFFFQHVLTIVGVTAVMLRRRAGSSRSSRSRSRRSLVALAYRYSHVSHPILRDVQQKMADVATVAEENIVGVHVVKAFAQEPQRAGEVRARARRRVFEQSVEANRQRALYVPLLAFLPLLAQAAVLLVGGRMVVARLAGVGGFIAFNLLVPMLVMPLRMLGMWIGQAQRATASGERIFEVLDEPEEVAERPGARELPPGAGPRPLRGRLVRLRRGRPVLDGHRPRARARPDGRADRPHRLGQDDARRRSCRASTTSTAGRVTVDGADVRDVTLDLAARARSASSRRTRSSSRRRVRENIAFGAPGRDRRGGRARRAAAQAHEFIGELPDGYDTVIGERGITLSGGQRQRIAIARALVVDPRILILDDATASVDATTEARIRLGLREAMQGRTTIIIAHRLSTIALADELVVLDDGRDRRARDARRAARDEPRLPRDLRARAARARVRGRVEARVRVGRRAREGLAARRRHLIAAAPARERRRLVVARQHGAPAARRSARLATAAVQARAIALASSRCSLATRRRSRRRTSRSSRSTTAIAAERPRRCSAGSSSRSSRGVANLCTSYAQTYFTGWTGERILADLRNELFRHLQRLSLGFYERNRAGVIISRLTNDVEALDQLVTDGVTTPRPEHADADRHGGHPLLPRLAARARDADGDAAHGGRDGAVPQRSARAYRAVRERLGARHGDARRGHRGMRVVQAFTRERAQRPQLPRGERALPRGEPRRRSS